MNKLKSHTSILAKIRKFNKGATALFIFNLLWISAHNANLPTEKDFLKKGPEWIEIANENPEAIIKIAVKKTLLQTQSIYNFPKEIKYDGLMKSQPDNKEYPTLLDINPKIIGGTPIRFITITIGNRKFNVSPIAGKITWIKFDNNKGLIMTTTYQEKVYDNNKKLPDLVIKLRTTSRIKWEKEWFFGVKVTEI